MGCVDFQIFEQSGRPIVAFEPREIENQAGLTCLLQALMKQGVHPFQVAFAELALAGEANRVVMSCQCLGEPGFPPLFPVCRDRKGQRFRVRGLRAQIPDSNDRC